jgi:hypothetical protein
MALNKHMAAAVAEMEADIKQLMSEIDSWPARARFKAKRAGLQRDVENLQAAIKTIDSLYGGPEPDNDPPVKYLNGATALMVAAALPEPLTALALAWAAVYSTAAASKCLKRWATDGWVRKVKHGRYVRTAKFPATVIPAE